MHKKEKNFFDYYYHKEYLTGLVIGRVDVYLLIAKCKRKNRDSKQTIIASMDDSQRDLIQFIVKYDNLNSELIAKHYVAETEFYPF